MAATFSIRNSRQLKAITGVSEEQFEKLEEKFGEVHEDLRRKAYEEAVERGERKRKMGGGSKGALPTIYDKLLFLLYYLKCYPTFDVISSVFNMSPSKACENIHKLLPVFYETLSRIDVLPHRNFENFKEMKKAFENIDQIIIDATERPHQRPKNSEKQSSMYSGKKKGHYLKNTIISSTNKIIGFIGKTFPGSVHDYTMLKEEFPPEFPWFEKINVLADLGYQGIKTDYVGDGIRIPHKKPRKSKNNPNPQLTKKQKEENRNLSSVRIFVENAIGGMKKFNVLNFKFRNKKEKFDDDVIALCAGLWNMAITT